MQRSRYIEDQIIRAIKQHWSGVKTQNIYRKFGIVEQTFYIWKVKFGRMDLSESKRLRELGEENSRLKRLLAEAELDKSALREVLSKSGEAGRTAADGTPSGILKLAEWHARWLVSAELVSGSRASSLPET
jgi:putative transposase